MSRWQRTHQDCPVEGHFLRQSGERVMTSAGLPCDPSVMAGRMWALFRNKHYRIERTIEDDKKKSTKHPQNSGFSGNHIFHFRSDEISRLSGVLGVQSQWCRPFPKKKSLGLEVWRVDMWLSALKTLRTPGMKNANNRVLARKPRVAAKKIQAEWAPPKYSGKRKTEVSKRFIDLKNATNAWGASGSWKFRLGIPTEFCPARRKGLRECIKGLSVVVDNPSNPLLLISMRPLSISSWIRGWLWQGRISYIPKITSRWFKVPFSSPSWRSLNPLKGSLNHPKKVTLNHQVVAMFFFFFFRTHGDILSL